jgi:hypothetical protein
MNRGNHEDYGCSVRFGFKEEIMSKYCLYSKLIMKKCVHTFSLLPVAGLITQQGLKDNLNRILVGKIQFKFTKLAKIKSINQLFKILRNILIIIFKFMAEFRKTQI